MIFFFSNNDTDDIKKIKFDDEIMKVKILLNSEFLIKKMIIKF